jgi:NAD(P)-dependent dehydrogenase (short-subunit alcohol dehydrogenase family)
MELQRLRWIIWLARSLAIDLKPLGIEVSLIRPSFVDTTVTPDMLPARFLLR